MSNREQKQNRRLTLLLTQRKSSTPGGSECPPTLPWPFWLLQLRLYLAKTQEPMGLEVGQVVEGRHGTREAVQVPSISPKLLPADRNLARCVAGGS
jgi:hypothetical protein